ncbi:MULTISPECIES: ABC transporter permease [Cryobacterium]|uniref:ABC transporter permease n=1 Tax=Cryobacterium levicorallinum TaxID=995038 RepID=A0A1I2XV26_9MICO|nr:MULTISPECIES: ABC transporter permease [Cryobacterium]TFB84945.1 ABC transporter permease [Cryobacterium levicorallinum]TFD62315.1 ABC transporter permease [Cryobacterium sp. Hh38]GEP26142.1 ABC transporter permease [Cryobacterium levicorallinum]SFH15971.1 ABC-2 type transport system permease protein [Cryobacterium levicorallinum]
MSNATRPLHTAPTFAQGVWLVSNREIAARLRSKSFLIATGILLFISMGSVIVGSIMSQNTSLTKVAVVGTAISVVEQTQAFDIVEASSAEDAEALVRDGTVDAAVVPSTNPASLLGITVIALDSAPGEVLGALSVNPELAILEPAEQDGFLAYLVAIGFGIIFLMSATTFGATIAQSVVEEKQTRIVEILLSTISVRALLAGKVLGNSLMAFAQIVSIGLLVSIGLAVTGQRVLLADVGPAIVWFAVFFAFGFVLLAALYAATASMVSRQEDVGSATSPVLFLVMIPYFMVVFFNDNPLVLAIMSYVPFSAPVGMPVRIFLGQAEWWEPVLSLVVLALSTMVVILIGSRIYSNALLRMGSRVSLREALHK